VAHVLHLVQLYAPAPSGAARYFHEIGRRLVRDGHRVTVLTSDAFDLEHLWLSGKRQIEAPGDLLDGVEIVRLPIRRITGPGLLYPILRRLMVEIGRSGRLSTPLLRALATATPRLAGLETRLQSEQLADVSIVHGANITLDFALLPLEHWAEQRGLRRLQTPFIHLGEPDNPQIARYYLMPHQLELLRNADQVATMTDIERSALIEHGIDPARLTVVGAGIEPAELDGGDADRFRRTYAITEPIVLSLGTAAFDKGTAHVLAALRRLWAEGRNVTWVQCGPLFGAMAAELERLSTAEAAHVRALGYVDDRTRRDALAAATVYAQPSRTDSFGITYLEAWYAHVPVIGARAGGVPGVVHDGIDGLLTAFGDVDAISAALRNLLDDANLRRRLAAAGRRRALAEYQWEHVYQRALPLYGFPPATAAAAAQ
jgi:glycosyltransferase involved in cell wall biosynthesis